MAGAGRVLRFTAQADEEVGNGDFYRANFATGAAQGGGGGQGVRGSEEIANIRRMLAGSLTAVERVEAVTNWADGGVINTSGILNARYSVIQ